MPLPHRMITEQGELNLGTEETHRAFQHRLFAPHRKKFMYLISKKKGAHIHVSRGCNPKGILGSKRGTQTAILGHYTFSLLCVCVFSFL